MCTPAKKTGCLLVTIGVRIGVDIRTSSDHVAPCYFVQSHDAIYSMCCRCDMSDHVASSDICAVLNCS